MKYCPSCKCDENDEYVTGVIIGYVKNSEVA